MGETFQVDCPAEPSAAAGTAFTCAATDDAGTVWTVRVTVNADSTVDWEVLGWLLASVHRDGELLSGTWDRWGALTRSMISTRAPSQPAQHRTVPPDRLRGALYETVAGA